MEKDTTKTVKAPVKQPETHYPEDDQEDYFTEAVVRGIKKAKKTPPSEK